MSHCKKWFEVSGSGSVVSDVTAKNFVPNWAPSFACSANKFVAFLDAGVYPQVFTPSCCKVDCPGFHTYNVSTIECCSSDSMGLHDSNWKLLRALSDVAMMFLLQEDPLSNLQNRMVLSFLIWCACVGQRRTPPSSVVGMPGNQELGARKWNCVMNLCLAHDQLKQRGQRMIEGHVLPLVYISCRTVVGLLSTGSVVADSSRFLLVAGESASDGAVACWCDECWLWSNHFLQNHIFLMYASDIFCWEDALVEEYVRVVERKIVWRRFPICKPLHFVSFEKVDMNWGSGVVNSYVDFLNCPITVADIRAQARFTWNLNYSCASTRYWYCS